MKYLFLFFLMILSNLLLPAQRRIQVDSSKIEERAINSEAIQNLKADKDFQFDQYREPPKSLWERFWTWVWQLIHRLMSTKQGRTTVWTLVIILALTALLFFILKLTGMNKESLFARNSDSNLPYTITSDDINTISFDEAINQAISQANFRLALRLLYLQSLKKLSDREYINWQINKTNNDYLYEVLNKPWHTLFKVLTRRFEYVWYGEMNITKEDFDQLKLQFQQLNNQL